MPLVHQTLRQNLRNSSSNYTEVCRRILWSFCCVQCNSTMLKTAISEGFVSLLVHGESLPHNTRTNHITYINHHFPSNCNRIHRTNYRIAECLLARKTRWLTEQGSPWIVFRHYSGAYSYLREDLMKHFYEYASLSRQLTPVPHTCKGQKSRQENFGLVWYYTGLIRNCSGLLEEYQIVVVFNQQQPMVISSTHTHTHIYILLKSVHVTTFVVEKP
jgi:hypothetical protein